MATTRRVDALVIGAGVSGLTTAVRFVEAGRSVRVLSAHPTLATTSAHAGASWGPYLVADPRVLRWSERSRYRFEELSKEPASGVRLISGLEAAEERIEPPSWAVTVRDFWRCEPHELPKGYVSGWRYTIPVVDMPRYLGYMIQFLAESGVVIERHEIATFREVAGEARVVVNCSGLGSRTLVPDAEVYPTRGQLVVVKNPGIDRFFQDHAEGEHLTYILPHGDHVVLGGSAIQHTANLEPDDKTAEAILARCQAVEPMLRDAPVLGHLVGLRPTRPEVRVERDEVAGTPLIHNYGHGGAGVTLSWGCADEVLELSEVD